MEQGFCYCIILCIWCLHFTVYIVRETHHFKQLYWVLLLWDTNALTTLIRLMNIISSESVIDSWLLHKNWGGHFYRRARPGCSSCTSGDETHCLPRHVNIVHVCRYQEQMKKNRIVSQVNIVTAAAYRSWEAGSDHATALLTQSFSYTGRRGRHRAQGWGERGWGQKNRFHPASLFTRGQTFPPLNSIFFFHKGTKEEVPEENTRCEDATSEKTSPGNKQRKSSLCVLLWLCHVLLKCHLYASWGRWRTDITGCDCISNCITNLKVLNRVALQCNTPTCTKTQTQ